MIDRKPEGELQIKRTAVRQDWQCSRPFCTGLKMNQGDLARPWVLESLAPCVTPTLRTKAPVSMWVGELHSLQTMHPQ